MRKVHKIKKLDERPNPRTLLLVLALSASLAAFGCTTNRTPGEGEPYTGGPAVGPSSTSGVTSGSSGGTTPTPSTPPSMTSSYTGIEPMPRITARSRTLPLSPDAAAAIMAGHQALQGVVLGPADPGSSGRGYVSDIAVSMRQQQQQSFYQPSLLDGAPTVNSSINSDSPGTPAITSGAGGADGGAAIIGSSVATGTTAAATIAGTGVTANATAPVFPVTSGVVTPTTAAIPFGPGVFAAGPPPGARLNAGTGATVLSAGTANATTTTSAVRVVKAGGRVVVTNSGNQ